MQGQDIIYRTARQPVTQSGKLLLNPAKDLPLLLLVRDSTFISRQQIELLMVGRTSEVVYRSCNRRLAHLADINQIQLYPQCFPYPGRIFGITHAGIDTLQLAGMGILSVSSDTETLADAGQASHFIGLNQIEIAARKAFDIRRWIGDRQLKSLNIAANRPTEKDYDSIAEIALAPDSNAVVHLGIEYERTVKSKERYAQIRKGLDAERQIKGLLYFVENETMAVFLAKEVYSAAVPVGVVIVSQFQSKGLDSPIRVVQDRSVVRVSVSNFIESIRRVSLQ